MGRPTQYPRQATVQLTDDQADRIDTDAALRGDGSKSAAHRRLLALGMLLADALAKHGTEAAIADPDNVLDDLLDSAEAVR